MRVWVIYNVLQELKFVFLYYSIFQFQLQSILYFHASNYNCTFFNFSMKITCFVNNFFTFVKFYFCEVRISIKLYINSHEIKQFSLSKRCIVYKATSTITTEYNFETSSKRSLVLFHQTPWNPYTCTECGVRWKQCENNNTIQDFYITSGLFYRSIFRVLPT